MPGVMTCLLDSDGVLVMHGSYGGFVMHNSRFYAYIWTTATFPGRFRIKSQFCKINSLNIVHRSFCILRLCSRNNRFGYSTYNLRIACQKMPLYIAKKYPYTLGNGTRSHGGSYAGLTVLSKPRFAPYYMEIPGGPEKKTKRMGGFPSKRQYAKKPGTPPPKKNNGGFICCAHGIVKTAIWTLLSTQYWRVGVIYSLQPVILWAILRARGTKFVLLKLQFVTERCIKYGNMCALKFERKIRR
jgi:hypothetical protein